MEKNKDLKGVFTHLPLEDVYYGADSIKHLSTAIKNLKINRALLITSKTLSRKTDLVERVIANSGGRIVAVFDETVQHVHRESVLSAIKLGKSKNVDGIITFGGGTANDTGKIAAAGISADFNNDGDFDHYRVKFQYPDNIEIPSFPNQIMPIIAIPTTLSAGEFTHFAGVTDAARKVKDLFIDKKLSAKVIILDAKLTLETPQWLWLSSGIRALDHCVESLCSSTAHPFTDALASHSLTLLNENLRKNNERESDLVVRTNCQLASWLSVCGLANVTLGMSHGIGHQLGARNDVPHGYTSCVMMVPTMVFNKEHVGDRQKLIANLMNIDTTNLTLDEASQSGRKAISKLISDLSLPVRLRDVGVATDDFPFLAKDALEDLIVATNPRPVKSMEEIIQLLNDAW